MRIGCLIRLMNEDKLNEDKSIMNEDKLNGDKSV